MVGDLESAVQAWRDALTILDELSLPEAAGLRAKLSNLASVTGDAAEDDRTRIAIRHLTNVRRQAKFEVIVLTEHFHDDATGSRASPDRSS